MKEFKMTIDDWSVLMNQQDRIERMLKWLVVQRIFDDEMIMRQNPMYDKKKRKIPTKIYFPFSAPDISDILEEK